MYIQGTMGLVGAVASVIALFLPAQDWKQKTIHAVYVLVIFCLAGTLIHKQVELREIHSIERAARRLIEDKPQMTTDGFIHASLAFLEKNKSHFPDTYTRAIQICEINQTFLSDDKIEGGTNKFSHSLSKLDVASAMQGILKGIEASTEGS